MNPWRRGFVILFVYAGLGPPIGGVSLIVALLSAPASEPIDLAIFEGGLFAIPLALTIVLLSYLPGLIPAMAAGAVAGVARHRVRSDIAWVLLNTLVGGAVCGAVILAGATPLQAWTLTAIGASAAFFCSLICLTAAPRPA